VGILAAWGLHFVGLDTARDLVLAVVGVVPLIPLLRGIVTKIRRREPGVDLIALVAVVAALALGEFLTAAVIGVMLATGQFLEEFAAGRAERELSSLVERAPKVAHRRSGDRIETVAVGAVKPGDLLVVKAGEVVPVDGVVVGRPALLDESALTGESLPIERAAGDLVSSGVLNAANPFEMYATSLATESAYAGIIRLVEEARESRAPSTRLADRWAGWFVPLSLSVAALAWMMSGDPVRGLAVLVVATPCPLLLAVPIAVVSGISRAARRGVVFRGGGPLEGLAQTASLLIDKTGTLTIGRPQVRSVIRFDHRVSETEVLRLAASTDQISTHVLARAIVDEAHRRDMTIQVPEGPEEEPGSGVAGRVDGRHVAVGKLGWLLQGRPESPAISEFRRKVARVTPSIVYVAVDQVVIAAIVFDDAIRPEAATTIRALRRLGVKRVVMATGDHQVVARSVGMAIGVDDVLAECTPVEKVEALDDLRHHGITAMVGDGINDAPALAAADVGIAMGARGATASSEAADVVLLVDQLHRLVDAIGIAQRSRRIAVQSAAIGMGLSLVAMGFASFGLLAPIAGALIQEAIDLIAIFNALRALGGKTPTEVGPKLPIEMSDELRAEHDELIPRLDLIRDTADSLDDLSGVEATEALRGVLAFLVDEILPHELNDEHEIYPAVAAVLPGDDPMATMSRTHREIFHLVDGFQRLVDDLGGAPAEPGEIRDLKRMLYGLHAILRLHFDQEEELYLTLQHS
jgi:heavy metal translocating P-type ATPase